MALEVTYSNVKIHIVDTGLRLNFSIFSSFKSIHSSRSSSLDYHECARFLRGTEFDQI